MFGAAIIAACGLLAWGLVGASGATDANANRAAAQSEATRLLSLVQLPPGATRSSTEPPGDHGGLAQSGYAAVTPNLVDASAWWISDSSPAAVLAYLRTHRPHGASPWSSTGDSGPNGAQVETFTLPAVSGVLSQRVIAVTATRLANGLTGIRVDGAAVWIVPRPAWEQIPSTVRTVTFTARGAEQSGRLGPVSTPLTLSGAAAQRLVSFINGLPIVQLGAYACPAGRPGWLRMTFRTDSGALVASANEQASGCASMALTIGGRRGPDLLDYPTVTSELLRLRAIPVCAARQLAGASTAPQSDPASQVLSLTFTNRSDAMCRVGGFPRLGALNAHGRRLPLNVRRAVNGPAVALAPGQAAAATVVWQRCAAPRATRVRVTLPGVPSAFTLRVGSSAAPFAPCHGRLTVTPLMVSF